MSKSNLIFVGTLIVGCLISYGAGNDGWFKSKGPRPLAPRPVEGGDIDISIRLQEMSAQLTLIRQRLASMQAQLKDIQAKDSE